MANDYMSDSRISEYYKQNWKNIKKKYIPPELNLAIFTSLS